MNRRYCFTCRAVRRLLSVCSAYILLAVMFLPKAVVSGETKPVAKIFNPHENPEDRQLFSKVHDLMGEKKWKEVIPKNKIFPNTHYGCQQMCATGSLLPVH